MASKILILPGDVKYNLGDMAICLGIIKLIKKKFPTAQIFIWARPPVLPADFQDVQFLHGKPILLIKAIFASCFIIWGGGQLLQGNRSRIKIPFWVAKIVLLKLIGKKIIGLGQDLGPFRKKTDRYLAKTAIACTRVFTVRDVESSKIMKTSPQVSQKIFLTADPALIIGTKTTKPFNNKKSPTIGISLRYTYHHHHNRIIPFQFLPEKVRNKYIYTNQYQCYLEKITYICDKITTSLKADIVFLPMYYSPWETDITLAASILSMMGNKKQATIFQAQHSVIELWHLFQDLDLFIGTPMHSTIFSTANLVPSLALYYEPKGLEYFKLIEQRKRAFCFDDMLSANGEKKIWKNIELLWLERNQVHKELKRIIPRIKNQAMSNINYLPDGL